MTEITDNPYPSGASTPTNQPSAGEEERSAVASAASRAGDEAAGIKDDAKAAAANVKDQAASEAAGVAGEARQEARNLVGTVQGRLDEQASDATRRLAGAIAGAAEDLRSMAERAERPDGPVANIVRELADRSADMAREIETNGYRGMADELARFGRNRAGLFLMAAGAAGFAVGRILRNTDTQAVVQAAKSELGGGDTGSMDTGEGQMPSAAMPGSGETVVTDVVVTETYTPVGTGIGGR